MNRRTTNPVILQERLMPAPPLNGIDTPLLAKTIQTISSHPANAKFEYHVTNHWISGTHSRSVIDGYYGIGERHRRAAAFTADSDSPYLLGGHDNGPSPLEYLLHALASCLTAGIVAISAARGMAIAELRSTTSGNIDLLPSLGLQGSGQMAFSEIHVDLTVKAEATPEVIRSIIEDAKANSPVHQMLADQVSISCEFA